MKASNTYRRFTPPAHVPLRAYKTRLERLCSSVQPRGAGDPVKLKLLLLHSRCLPGCMSARAEVASIYGNGDGLCGHLTASGEHFDCSAMTAAHRSLPFGTLVNVCHDGCVTVRINDRGPFARGRDIDLSPAAARAINLHQTGHVQMSR